MGLPAVRWWKSRPRFRSSLTTGIAGALAIILALMMAVVGFVISQQVRSQIFNTRKQAVLSDASVRVTQVQNALDQATVTSVEQVQDLVSQLVVSTRDSAAGAGVTAVMLMRTTDSSDTFVLNEYVNRQMISVITPGLEDLVNSSGGAWQSVEVPYRSAGTAGPGIAVGALVEVPLAGPYQIYLIYSLETDQHMADMFMRFLAIAAVPLLIVISATTFVVIYRMMRPVRLIGQAANRLSEGDLQTRVDIPGRTEMAQLGHTFNQMAESLQDQILEYDALSQLQQRFVSDVSHELRTPLTTIAMAEDIIHDSREDLPAAPRRAAELLHSEVDRMEHMLADLLEISRYDAQKMQIDAEMTDLYALTVRAVDEVHELADHLSVEVEVGPCPDDPLAEVDAKRLSRVVRNLLVNSYEHAERRPVKVEFASEAEAISIAVVDSGVGMSEETMARVFDRFFRADPSRARLTGGTGLGLAIAREDIVAHAAKIEVFSELAVGTAFVVTLPRQQDTPLTTFPFRDRVWFE